MLHLRSFSNLSSLLIFAEQRLSVCVAQDAHFGSGNRQLDARFRILAPNLELVEQGFPLRSSAQAYSKVLHNPRGLFNVSPDTGPMLGQCQAKLPNNKEILPIRNLTVKSQLDQIP